ncbi:MAG: hypothetical protein K2K99_00265, partial [Muribaculaceae bacterium]|nr:hypothetical protein [Muribaculaceae bacterium]
MLKPETGTFTHYYMLPQVIGGQMLFPVMMLVIYWLSGYYNNPNERSRAQELLTTLGSALTGALVIFFLAVVNDLEFRRRVAIELVGILAILFFLLVYAGRSIITLSTVRSIHRRNRFKPVVMIGDDPESRSLAAKINGLPRGMGLKIVAFVNPDDNDPAKVCRTHGSDTVIVSPQLARSGSMPSLLSMLMPADLAVGVSPGIYEFHTAAGRIIDAHRCISFHKHCTCCARSRECRILDGAHRCLHSADILEVLPERSFPISRHGLIRHLEHAIGTHACRPVLANMWRNDAGLSDQSEKRT